MSQVSLLWSVPKKMQWHKAEGLVAGTGMQSEADIKSAKLGAAATRYAGQQAGNAAMFGGLMSGISGIAGGAIDKYGKCIRLF